MIYPQMHEEFWFCKHCLFQTLISNQYTQPMVSDRQSWEWLWKPYMGRTCCVGFLASQASADYIMVVGPCTWPLQCLHPKHVS